MPFYHYGSFSRFDSFWHEDVDFYFVIANFLVGSAIRVETLESVGSGGT